MPYFFGLLLIASAAYLVLVGLARAEVRGLVSGLRMTFPILLACFAVAFALSGRPAVGAFLAVVAVLLGVRARRKRTSALALRRPVIRSPWLELQVGKNWGEIDGVVLAGELEGSILSALNIDALLNLHREMIDDAESRPLMETYLDSRMPGWRGYTNSHVGNRQGRAPGAGAMAYEEAYQILGLESGASAADIRKAHRRLSERMRVGAGPIPLQGRIDEARDVLLARHD